MAKIRKANKRIQIAENIKLTQENHDKLLKYIERRLEFANDGRNARVERYRFIDREVAGYMVLDTEDKKRMLDNIKGKGVKTVDFILELTGTQLDEFITFLASVLFADEDVYHAFGDEKQQNIINGLTKVMKKHGTDFQHFTNFIKGCYDMAKYNFGGFVCEWVEIFGNKLRNNETRSELEITRGIVKSGNCLRAIDPYNFLYDLSVSPVELYQKGEFFAIPTLVTPFQVRKMYANKEIWDVDRFMDMEEYKFDGGNYGIKYYESKPSVIWHGMFVDGVSTDWHSVLSGVEHAGVGEKLEHVYYFGWLNPKDFGLSDNDELQIWRITTMANEHIVSAEHLNNAHGHLPCAIGMPRYDGFETTTKSFAESLAPLQRFGSNELNVRQRSARKKLYGLTVYDAQQIPLMEKADLLGGKVPWRPAGQDRDIRKAVLQLNDAPITDDTLQNVESVINLMQKLLPTDILKQVAELERATIYQAASVVQGGNRRLFKYARVISDQAVAPIRMMQIYNILQFVESMVIIDNETGQPQQISPAQLRDAELEHIVAGGIKGMDRLLIVEMLRDVLGMILQSQPALQQIDVIKFIDYWTNLIGEKVDFASFKIQSPIDQLSPEEKNMAFQLFQQAQQQQQGGQPGGNVTPLPAAE